MSRRSILTAVELAMTASALSAATYGLVRASYDPYAAVQWVPVVVVGIGTALALVGLAAVLFVGRAALLLSADAADARRWRRPPSQRGRQRPGTGSRPTAPVDGRHARAMAAVAAQPALPARDGQTVRMPVVRVPARDWAGVGR